MAFKINMFWGMVILAVLLSCKKENDSSDLIFSDGCSFSASQVEVVNHLNGLLRYTDNIKNVSLSGYKFVIESSGHLPMVVCNMPATFQMTEGKARNVKFGGRILIISDQADAVNTNIELNYLKFQ
ncbi:hypothetical protein ACFSPU_05035 [Haoranjiania flava]|uniref:Lipoprotein n=1 Tax=Haoranjiania flava TaxID=1856322 RepID=A0AAE3INT7_9BACT|nr:hypothetical protein [Haoranjiania flava]MCU7693691.1 hypothetical protein [Haoranjiania flava]